MVLVKPCLDIPPFNDGRFIHRFGSAFILLWSFGFDRSDFVLDLWWCKDGDGGKAKAVLKS
jgi:hypothetical protein